MLLAFNMNRFALDYRGGIHRQDENIEKNVSPLEKRIGSCFGRASFIVYSLFFYEIFRETWNIAPQVE